MLANDTRISKRVLGRGKDINVSAIRDETVRPPKPGKRR